MPSTMLSKPAVARFLSEIALSMTSITDRYSGIGVGINAHVSGSQGGNRVSTLASLYHSDTAMLAGYGSAIIASKLIDDRTRMHGVWPVEQFLSTKDFHIALRHKNIALQVLTHT